MDPTDCADTIVKGMLKNEDTLIMPEYFYVIVKLTEYMKFIDW
jgi:hypothetical protein